MDSYDHLYKFWDAELVRVRGHTVKGRSRSPAAITSTRGARIGTLRELYKKPTIPLS